MGARLWRQLLGTAGTAATRCGDPVWLSPAWCWQYLVKQDSPTQDAAGGGWFKRWVGGGGCGSGREVGKNVCKWGGDSPGAERRAAAPPLWRPARPGSAPDRTPVLAVPVSSTIQYQRQYHVVSATVHGLYCIWHEAAEWLANEPCLLRSMNRRTCRSAKAACVYQSRLRLARLPGEPPAGQATRGNTDTALGT